MTDITVVGSIALVVGCFLRWMKRRENLQVYSVGAVPRDVEQLVLGAAPPRRQQFRPLQVWLSMSSFARILHPLVAIFHGSKEIFLTGICLFIYLTAFIHLLADIYIYTNDTVRHVLSQKKVWVIIAIIAKHALVNASKCTRPKVRAALLPSCCRRHRR